MPIMYFNVGTVVLATMIKSNLQRQRHIMCSKCIINTTELEE